MFLVLMAGCFPAASFWTSGAKIHQDHHIGNCYINLRHILSQSNAGAMAPSSRQFQRQAMSRPQHTILRGA